MKKAVYAATLAVMAAGAVYASGPAVNALRTSVPSSVPEHLALPAPEYVKADARRNNGYSRYENVSEAACPGGKVAQGVLVCSKVKDAYKILGTKIDRKYAVENLPGFVNNTDPVSLGLLPDDGTDTIFYYAYKLVSEPGAEELGYAEITGNANSEAGFRTKTTLKYNAEGRLAVIKIENR